MELWEVKIDLGILETKLELTIDKNTNTYFTFICKDNVLIPFQCDTGASYTSISALALNNKYYDPEKAYKVEEQLLKRSDLYTLSQKKKFVKTFTSATGEKVYGFLTDIGNVSIGDLELKHFYYYFVPKNNSAFALLGNDFLNNCEFTHKFDGNIVVNRFNEDEYYLSHNIAISSVELNLLIEKVSEELDVAEEFEK